VSVRTVWPTVRHAELLVREPEREVSCRWLCSRP